MGKLKEIVQDFREIDEDFRLDLLLDYSEKLPPLPMELHSKIRHQQYRVSECQTPVYLEITSENNHLKIQVDVPSESPTIRGIISLLVIALNGCSLKNLEEIPVDLLHRLGLANRIGSLRFQGINAIIHRLRREIKQLNRQ